MTEQQDNKFVDIYGRHTRNDGFFKYFSLASIASIISLCIAGSFIVSLIYNLIFFRKINLDPLLLPLTISDYIISFSFWTFSAIYLIFLTSVSFLIKRCVYEILESNKNITIYRNKKIIIFILLLMSLFFFISISLLFLFAYVHYVLSLITIAIGFLLIIFIITPIFLNRRFSNMIAIVLISITLPVAILCWFFPILTEEQIKYNLNHTQTFEYREKNLKGSLLRSFEKGILVYSPSDSSIPGDRAHIIFLPTDNGATLTFPTAIIPAQDEAHDLQRPKEELPDAG